MRRGNLVIDISIIVLISVFVILGLSYLFYFLAGYKVLYNYLVIISVFVLFLVWRVLEFFKMKNNGVSVGRGFYVAFVKPVLIFVAVFVIVSLLVMVILLLNLY